ncbi:MAG: metallophosphoesterase [Candidatus Thermoplasmatota archaeon]
MRILAVADLHGAQYRLNLVLKNITAHHPDLVVISGDITQFGPGELATTLLNQLSVQTLAVPGNIDTFDVDQGIAVSTATNLHRRQIIIQGVPFIGIGREIPSHLPDLLIDDGTNEKPLKTLLKKNSVLVTHYPPFKLQDKIFLGTHGGSKELRSLIEAYMPRLVLCAHIHEDPGMTSIGQTTVVNCSMGKRTEGAVIDIDDSVHIKILE